MPAIADLFKVMANNDLACMNALLDTIMELSY